MPFACRDHRSPLVNLRLRFHAHTVTFHSAIANVLRQQIVDLTVRVN
jgi:hypothetical protein